MKTRKIKKVSGKKSFILFHSSPITHTQCIVHCTKMMIDLIKYIEKTRVVWHRVLDWETAYIAKIFEGITWLYRTSTGKEGI